MIPLTRKFSEPKSGRHVHFPVLKVYPKKAEDQGLSPSISTLDAVELPSYEMKFLLPEKTAVEIESILSREMIGDAHEDLAKGSGYQVTTLYTDTDWHDVYYHEKPFKRHKYRLRRYGMDSRIFLERRSRWRDRIKKQRNEIWADELSLFSREGTPADWAGRWFHQRMIEGNLHPVCRITYHRSAYYCGARETGMRLTFDRSVRGCLTEDWRVKPFEGGLALFEGVVVCEVKFCCTMPPRFKQIIRDFELGPRRISKYRVFLDMACNNIPGFWPSKAFKTGTYC